MWSRGTIGVVLCLVGALWIAQGTDAIHGSGMSGRGLFAALGGAIMLIGSALVTWAVRIRRTRTTG
jgi:hypothetical protein